MPKRSKDGRRRLCEVFTIGGVGSETLDGGRTVPAKLRLRSGFVSWSGLGRSGREAAGNGKGGTRDGSRRAELSFRCAELDPRRATDLGQNAPTSPSGEVGGLDKRPMSRCGWSTRADMLLSIIFSGRTLSRARGQGAISTKDEASNATGAGGPRVIRARSELTSEP